MRATLIRIGNSRGVRLPKAVIAQAGLTDDLDLEIVDGAVIIRAAQNPRQGWAEAAKACHEAGDDYLADWDATVADFDGRWE